ncbi:MAG: AgmX/PglI C-terminal domain-containing protein [Myxococcaceae bacterium]
MTPSLVSGQGVLARVQWGVTTVDAVFIPPGAQAPTLVRDVEAGRLPGLVVERQPASRPERAGRWGRFDVGAVAGPLVVLMCFASALFAIALESADRYLGPGTDAGREGLGDGSGLRRPVGFFSRPSARGGAPAESNAAPAAPRAEAPSAASAPAAAQPRDAQQAARAAVSNLFGHDVIETGPALTGELRDALAGLNAPRLADGGPGLASLRGTGEGGGGQLAGIGVVGIGNGRLGGSTSGATGRRGTGSGAYGSGVGIVSGRTSSDVGLTIVEPTIIGVLDRALIRAVVRRHASQVRYCYELALQRRPELAGRVKVKWVIDASGAVATSSLDESDVGDTGLETCLVSRVRTWEFPKPVGGGVVVVHYPFVFKAND